MLVAVGNVGRITARLALASAQDTNYSELQFRAMNYEYKSTIAAFVRTFAPNSCVQADPL